MKEEKYFLIFKVDSFHFCAPVDNVLGIIIPPPVTKMPLTPFHVVGTFLFRDYAALAIDLRRQFGLEEFKGKAGLFIVTQLESGIVGFWVDGVTTIVTSLKLTPCHIHFPVLHRFFKEFVLLDDEILLQTDFEMLFEADDCAVSLPGLPDVVPWTQADQSQDLEEERAAVAASSGGVLVVDQVRPDSMLSDSETEAQPESEPEVESKPEPEATPISPPAPGPKESKGVGAAGVATEKRGGERKVTADSSRNLTVQRARPRKEFASAPNKETRALLRASLSQGKRRQDTLPSFSGPLARQAKTRLSSSSPPVSKSNAGEDSGLGWWRLVFAVIIMAVLVLMAMFWWPEEEGLTPKFPGVKEVAKEVARPPLKRDLYLQGEAREAIVEEKVLKTAVVAPPQAPLDEPPPVSSLKGPTELVRVETRDFTLTIERPSVHEQKTESVILPLAAEEGSIGTDVMITHIVVKNDTLWAIANRYLGNPLEYAELARLSRIKDPHWIYPGDIIRIVKKSVNDQ